MNFLKKIFLTHEKKPEVSTGTIIKKLKSRYCCFVDILEYNDKILKIISDIEEKKQGNFLFDMNYITNSINKLKENISSVINLFLKLGGNKYSGLNDRYKMINSEIENLISGKSIIPKDSFTIPLNSISKDKESSVGAKCANLGELKSVLLLPVPDGFAISAFAYKTFMEVSGLQEKISGLIYNIDLKNINDLKKISETLRSLILNTKLPENISNEILDSFDKIFKNNIKTTKVAMRSSAIGEDTKLSFAGQYISILGVTRENLFQSYLLVLASKFTPKAIYYYLNHNLKETNLAMSVCCLEMVDAGRSGVIYSRNPVDSGDDSIYINSIFGLGQYLVDGTVEPDYLVVDRNNFKITDRYVSYKSKKLVLLPDLGTKEINIEENERELPSLNDDEAIKLAEIALKIENHYDKPQDIEWAISSDGKIYILQARPLKIIIHEKPSNPVDTTHFTIKTKGKTTACPGIKAGNVHFIRTQDELDSTEPNSVIVAESPFPGLVSALNNASALLTKNGSPASHLVTIAREYRIPAIVGISDISVFIEGEPVTVDASECTIYEGNIEELVNSSQPEFDYFNDEPLQILLNNLAEFVTPLSRHFQENTVLEISECRTFHDIIRFIHQKSMEEIFENTDYLAGSNQIGIQLKSTIPLKIKIISLDDDNSGNLKNLNEEELPCIPLKAFWDGVLEEGWQLPPAAADFSGFATVMATDMTKQKFKTDIQNSYAAISSEFMILNLKLGYHFTTIESMCSSTINKNYIKLRIKEGGASFERRLRRVNLIKDILVAAGFEVTIMGDYLEAVTNYNSCMESTRKLKILGRLTMLTRQLDLALKDDEEAEYYTDELIIKLGLAN